MVCTTIYNAGTGMRLCLCRSPYGIIPNAQSSALVDPTTAAVVPVPIVAEGANHILLFTVFNPMYPITVVSWMGGWWG